jgi:hypothetical protein
MKKSAIFLIASSLFTSSAFAAGPFRSRITAQPAINTSSPATINGLPAQSPIMSSRPGINTSLVISNNVTTNKLLPVIANAIGNIGSSFFMSPAREKVFMPALSNAIYGRAIGRGMAQQGGYAEGGAFTVIGSDMWMTTKGFLGQAASTIQSQIQARQAANPQQ